jgi:hypothetical protein
MPWNIVYYRCAHIMRVLFCVFCIMSIHWRRTKSNSTARKSFLEWVKLQRLVAKCCKMTKIYTALWSSQILYIFELRAVKITTFHLSAQIWSFFPRVMQIYTKHEKLHSPPDIGLYFPHFTTIRNQTLQFFSFRSCLDQNFVYSWNHWWRQIV